MNLGHVERLGHHEARAGAAPLSLGPGQAQVDRDDRRPRHQARVQRDHEVQPGGSATATRAPGRTPSAPAAPTAASASSAYVSAPSGVSIATPSGRRAAAVWTQDCMAETVVSPACQ